MYVCSHFNYYTQPSHDPLCNVCRCWDISALATFLLRGDASLFENVGLDVAAGDLALHVEVDADELAEAGAVVVAGRLGVSKRLQDRVRLHDLVLERRLLRLLLALPGADHGEVRDDLFGILRLAGAGLTPILQFQMQIIINNMVTMHWQI